MSQTAEPDPIFGLSDRADQLEAENGTIAADGIVIALVDRTDDDPASVGAAPRMAELEDAPSVSRQVAQPMVQITRYRSPGATAPAGPDHVRTWACTQPAMARSQEPFDWYVGPPDSHLARRQEPFDWYVGPPE